MKCKVFKQALLGLAVMMPATVCAQPFTMELQASTDEVEYWYRICSAVPGMEQLVMTDCSDQNDVCQVQLLPTVVSNEKSQWKLTVSPDDMVLITNRATGLQLHNASKEVGEHNATQLTAGDSQGFDLLPLGGDAVLLMDTEIDGVTRCLAIAERGTEASKFPESDGSTSIVGWKFTFVESVQSVVKTTKGTAPTIRVCNRRVTVSGCKNWQLFNAQGEEMPRTTKLAPGAYMVKTPEGVTKVMVK